MLLLRRRAPAHRLASGQVVEISGRPVRLRVDGRAARVSLRVDPRQREVVATAPSLRMLSDAVAFAQSRADWIAARLDGLPEPQLFAPGRTISLLGRPCRLERAAMRIAARLIPAAGPEPMRLIASGEGEAYHRAVVRVLKAEALRELTVRAQGLAARLGQPAPEVAVADARTRWGSCRGASGGRPALIRFSWRLILAPEAVLQYVAAHECAHLVEANHGPRFWALCARLYGDAAPARRWLAAHGRDLHAIQA